MPKYHARSLQDRLMKFYNTNTTVRINKLELELIKNYAKSLGTTHGALMRELALEAAKRAATAGNGLGFDSQEQ